MILSEAPPLMVVTTFLKISRNSIYKISQLYVFEEFYIRFFNDFERSDPLMVVTTFLKISRIIKSLNYMCLKNFISDFLMILSEATLKDLR